jgi:hypothetical protein
LVVVVVVAIDPFATEEERSVAELNSDDPDVDVIVTAASPVADAYVTFTAPTAYVPVLEPSSGKRAIKAFE